MMFLSQKISKNLVIEKELNPDVLEPKVNNKLYPKDLKKDFVDNDTYNK
jgi:hypothetical protein